MEAATPEHDHVPHVDQYEQGFGSDVTANAEGRQYHEVSMTQSIPVKTGDEDPMSGELAESDRPLSAGTSQSGQFELDNPEEAAFLASMTTHPKAQSGIANESIDATPITGQLLARPESSDGINADAAFSFARASRQQMNFTGTRKGPAANATAVAVEVQEEVNDNPVHDYTMSGVVAIQDTNVPNGMSPPHASRQTLGEGMTSAEQMTLEPGTHAGEKKRRKKKKRRYETAPSERIPDDAFQPPYDFTTQASLQVESAPSATATSLENHVGSDKLSANDFVQRPTTPPPAVTEHHYHEPVSSPHSQLHSDLQAAVEYTAPLTHDLGSRVLTPPSAEGLPLAKKRSARGSSLPPGQKQSHGHSYENVEHAVHNLSEDAIPARVSKRKQKQSRRATAPIPTEHDQASESPSDVIDYVQILAYKIREREQSASAKFASERERLQVELQQALDARQTLQEELNNVLQFKESLSTTVDKQKAKLTAYESKVNRFKTFVDGLGKDVDSLKKDANAARRQGEQLAQERDERKTERDALHDQLNTCAERSAQLKDQALKACHEIQSELQNTVARNVYLDRQLSESVGLLAEERDRRAQVERQLASAVTSHESVLKTLHSNNTSVLVKLSEVHEALKESQVPEKASDMLKRTFAAINELDSQSTCTVEGIASVKEILEGLSESLTKQSQDKTTVQDVGEDIADGIKAHLDGALKELKQGLANHEALAKQGERHRDVVHGLEEQLKAAGIRVANEQSLGNTAKSNEAKLKEQNEKLQAKITALQSEFSPAENAQVQLNEARAELALKAKALESARVDLESKQQELQSLEMTNANLREQLEALQSRIEALQNKAIDLGPQQHEPDQDATATEERIRREMAKHVEEFQAQLRSDFSNDLKKLTAERNRFERQVKPLQEELATIKARSNQLQKENATAKGRKEQELQRANKLADSQKQEIESLQSALNDLRSTAQSENAMQEKHKDLTAQLSVEKKKLKQAMDEKVTLVKQLDDLRIAAEETHLAEEHAKSELQKCRDENNATIKALKEKLAEANGAVERSAAGLGHLKGSCKKAIDDATSKSDRQIKALQEALSESQAEVQLKKTEDEEFRSQVERTWQQERQDHEERSATFKRQLAEAEAQRDETQANGERIREELQKKMDEQRDALLQQLEVERGRAVEVEDKEKSQHRILSRGSNTSSRIHVPNLKAGITPNATSRAMEPPRPRKKVDRNSNATVEVGPIPAPEEIRPDSRRTDSAKGKEPAKGPVVEESQLVSDPFAGHTAEPSRLVRDQSSLMMFSDNDDMLTVKDGGSQRLPHTVQETQYEDRLPSFAAFNSSIASAQAPLAHRASSTISVRPLSGSNSYNRHGRNVQQGQKAHQPPADFAIYEDLPESDGSPRPEDAEERRHLQDSLSWSQAEKDKYTFQKSYPHPNSASKMVPLSGQTGDNLRRGGSDSQRSATSRDGRFATPNARSQNANGPSKNVNALFPHSSSPDFMGTNNTSGRKMSTYHPPGGSSGKRRLSRTNSGPAVDPRLAGRNPQTGTKRKSEGYIVEGYEHERKKRLGAASIASEQASRGSPSHTRPSANDMPRFPTMPAGPRTSQTGMGRGGSQSRMRTLAGGTSRATRGAKKMSKNDEFNARFSQELDGR